MKYVGLTCNSSLECIRAFVICMYIDCTYVPCPPPQDEYSLLVENWNTQRGQALAHALLKVLYPQLEKELRMTLIQEAREAVLHVSPTYKGDVMEGRGRACAACGL